MNFTYAPRHQCVVRTWKEKKARLPYHATVAEKGVQRKEHRPGLLRHSYSIPSQSVRSICTTIMLVNLIQSARRPQKRRIRQLDALFNTQIVSNMLMLDHPTGRFLEHSARSLRALDGQVDTK
jgi:hypothetical protein